ncbi:MAG: hypothetical protein GC138_09550 [Gammaproteobacteria bacterium]|nr:hypothetical protein [Gammaproteobacteria bacterium]
MNIRRTALAVLMLSLASTVRAEPETSDSTGTSELPQALFILPWQAQGKVPEARKRWLDKLPPSHVETVDERELTRQVNYHAVLSRTASAAARGKGTQEE